MIQIYDYLKKIVLLFIIFNLIIVYTSNIVYSTSSDENNIINYNSDDKNKNELSEIKELIQLNNVNWNANFTTVSENINNNSITYLGCIEEDLVDSECEDISFTGFVPDIYDWRNVDGIDWTTSVKNQGGCGSCTSFATIGVIESLVQIEVGIPFDCDLSESHLFFCSGGKCSLGLSITDAANYMRSNGVSDELCFPYKSYDMSCNDKLPNWRDRVIRVFNTERVSYNIDAIKNALLTYGPLVTSMKVYSDFFYYRSGIYEHVSGRFEGLHAVAIVGYNEDSQYWICKNSWGTGWGEDGWFNIKYEDSGIGQNTRYFSGITGNIQPFKPECNHPSNGENNIERNVNLTWTSGDANGNNLYYDIYFSKGHSLNDLDIIANNITNNYINIKNLEKSTVYSWKIIAEDEYGSKNEGSISTFETRPPTKPNVFGPVNCEVGKEYIFQAKGGDNDGDNYFWFFDWGDGSNSGWIGPLSSGESVNKSHSWIEKGEYTLKVRYKEDDKKSEWSEPLIINIPKSKTYNFNIFKLIWQQISFRFPFFLS